MVCATICHRDALTGRELVGKRMRTLAFSFLSWTNGGVVRALTYGPSFSLLFFALAHFLLFFPFFLCRSPSTLHCGHRMGGSLNCISSGGILAL